MSNSAALPPQQNGDEPQGIEELLSRYVDELSEVGFIDPQQVLADHPDLGPAVLEDLKAYIQLRSDGNESKPLGTLGDYTLRRQIGRGGMGVVYEAWENSMDRRVALKVLPMGVAADERALQRFVREAKTAGQLNHPNVVSVYGMGLREQTPYYAMEFVEGDTLAQLIKRLKDAASETETPFGPKDQGDYFIRVGRAFADVADGLQHAHSKGVIHRDIKPSNLILDREGRLRILDFGLSHLEGQESLTASGDFLGTPLYMSPEQARRKKIEVDHRTDVYSLGATIYETVAGRPPFQGKDNQDTLSQIIERDPVEPRKVNPRIPRDLETIVLKCLRKEPADRYGTAEALAQDLRRFTRGDPIEARPESHWERLSRGARRHRWKLLATACGCLALLVISWFAWRGQMAERDANRLRHDREVGDAAIELHQGQLTLLGRDLGGAETLYNFRAQKIKKIKKGLAAMEPMLGRLRQVVDAVPERPDAPYYLARFYRLLGKDEAALREAAIALERDRSFAPGEVLSAEIARREFPLEDPALEEILARYRGKGGWQEPWLLAYRGARERKWAEAAEAYGRILVFYEQEGEPYIGCAVEALMGRGLARLMSEDFGGAICDFASARGVWPRLHEAGLFLGRAWYEMGEKEEAERVFLELHSACAPEMRNELATWIALTYADLGDTGRQSEWSDRIAGWERDRLHTIWIFHSGRYEEGVEKGLKVLEESPDDLVTLVFVGWARFLIQRDRFGAPWDEERRELLALAQRTVDLYPNDPTARLLLAVALSANGRREEALREASEACQVNLRLGEMPFFSQTVIGGILRARGELEKAREVMEKAREVLEKTFQNHPDLSIVRNELARVLEAEKRYEEALLEYRELARQEPGSATYHAELAGVLSKLGRHEEAVECARKAIGLFPRNTPGFENLAHALWKLGRAEEALEAAEAGIRALPGRVWLQLVRGQILEALGRVEEAARSYGEALELRPDFPEAREALQRLKGRGEASSGNEVQGSERREP